MFGGGSSSAASKSVSGSASDSGSSGKDRSSSKSPPPEKEAKSASGGTSPKSIKSTDQSPTGDTQTGNGSPPSAGSSSDSKKKRSSGVSGRASSLIAQAKNTLFTQVSSRNSGDMSTDSKNSNQTSLQKLGKQDQALAVPQGQHNNAAGESLPGPRSTFKVGVWEDRNKKCRRTMEDTHAFLYNFLHTPAPVLGAEGAVLKQSKPTDESHEQRSSSPASQNADMIETDNGYFAIFDGHAGTFAADWCGKKLHIILEDIIKKNPNAPIPELLDQTFTTVDAELEALPLKNSGCTAAVAVLRWEDRVPSNQSATGSQAIAPAVVKATEDALKVDDGQAEKSPNSSIPEATHAKLKNSATRQRVLYTANVGDARIVLCRSGKALRLSYDHKGSDENEGKRIANAGGLILNNRVNGVLAVTRALGDTYIKDLVTGHPYTTETVIQPEWDEFMIIACDGLWDVCSDQEAVDLVRDIQEPVIAAKKLVDHALSRFSTDNLSCMIVRFDKQALLENQNNKDSAIGVEGDATTAAGTVTETEKIVTATKQKIAEGSTPAVGISASNFGRGHDPTPIEDGDKTQFVPTTIEGSVEEEPVVLSDSPEATPEATSDGSVTAMDLDSVAETKKQSDA
ncbi:phosphatase 2C-like domain-containing protein [Sordaria brevicollis]|uniref:Phosphatase 2C-like domain-containing protein n=1 Tax=Sordaria brevicollis TaxID=83679 RepID=A0AAE0PG28_SORBR|nr:phosphatase 2C-like domain-containing protein [Sordaria brevicollis]